jgi:hypothetical protein
MVARRSPAVRTFSALVVLTALIAGPHANAEGIELATATLKACVEAHIPDERKAAEPSVDKLLDACKNELNDVLGRVPRGALHDVQHQIRNETDEMLKKNDG